MNQMKYSVYAFLLMILIASAIFLANTFIFKTSPDKNFVVEPSEQPTEIVINSEGKILFTNHCSQCHHLDKDLTGPALRGVETRGPWTDRKNLVLWLRNPGGMITKFNYTKHLFEKYGSMMTSFPNLTDSSIHQIFDYIKHAPNSVPVPNQPVAQKL